MTILAEPLRETLAFFFLESRFSEPKKDQDHFLTGRCPNSVEQSADVFSRVLPQKVKTGVLLFHKTPIFQQTQLV